MVIPMNNKVWVVTYVNVDGNYPGDPVITVFKNRSDAMQKLYFYTRGEGTKQINGLDGDLEYTYHDKNFVVKCTKRIVFI